MTQSSSFLIISINSLSANPTKWSKTLQQFVDNLPTNCLSVFDYFVGLALKGLTNYFRKMAISVRYTTVKKEFKISYIYQNIFPMTASLLQHFLIFD